MVGGRLPVANIEPSLDHITLGHLQSRPWMGQVQGIMGRGGLHWAHRVDVRDEAVHDLDTTQC